MTEGIIRSGLTVEQAIENAISELNISREQADIEIIEEGNKGFLGIGQKLATVKVNLKEQKTLAQVDVTKATKLIDSIAMEMGLKVSYEIKEEDSAVTINISGDNMGLIIGKHGSVLDAIQYLCSLVINKSREDYIKVIVDTEGYRKNSEEKLISIAKRTAARVQTTKRSVTLEPMNANERRIVHSALQDVNGISTSSIGTEPYRKVVISAEK